MLVVIQVESFAAKMKANLLDNAKFFAELGIDTVKQEIMEAGLVKAANQPSKKGYKEK